jgi:hypothetical protein
MVRHVSSSADNRLQGMVVYQRRETNKARSTNLVARMLGGRGAGRKLCRKSDSGKSEQYPEQ